MSSPHRAGVHGALKSSIASTLHQGKQIKSCLSWNINSSCQHQHSRVLVFKVIILKENLFSALGPPNREQSYSKSYLSVYGCLSCLNLIFHLVYNHPQPWNELFWSQYLAVGAPKTHSIVRAGFLRRPFRDLSHSVSKFVSPPSPYNVFSFKQKLPIWSGFLSVLLVSF